jgi:hypothetical protein
MYLLQVREKSIEDDWWHQVWSEGSHASDLGNPMVSEFIQSMVMKSVGRKFNCSSFNAALKCF